MWSACVNVGVCSQFGGDDARHVVNGKTMAHGDGSAGGSSCMRLACRGIMKQVSISIHYLTGPDMDMHANMIVLGDLVKRLG